MGSLHCNPRQRQQKSVGCNLREQIVYTYPLCPRGHYSNRLFPAKDALIGMGLVLYNKWPKKVIDGVLARKPFYMSVQDFGS